MYVGCIPSGMQYVFIGTLLSTERCIPTGCIGIPHIAAITA